MKKTTLLFLIIFIEGYVVLASELLAIRQLIPFVGSGTEVISIIISAVLLPLAAGYHFGGRSFKSNYAKAKNKNRKPESIRKILLKNIVTALIILSLGLSYLFLELFFFTLTNVGIYNRIAQTSIYSLIFLVTPVFLLGQTVPLISNYFSNRKLSEITGKMLFFSTTGSFFGSVFSTLILMMTIGVHNTVIITMGLLCILIILLAKRLLAYEVWLSAFVLWLLFIINGNEIMHKIGIVSDNAYNTARIEHNKSQDIKTLILNRSRSSSVDSHGNSQFGYIKFINKNFIAPLEKTKTSHDILVIGAGGFTVGINDRINNYTFIDIDKSLKTISEKHFLSENLSKNKKFIADSARAFVNDNKNKYDLVIIDTYTNVISIPMETTTKEFLEDIKKLLKDNGIVVANIIMSPNFQDKFSIRYNNTFASVFFPYSRQIIGGFNPYEADNARTKDLSARNALYIYQNNPQNLDTTIYTDDKNTFSIDRN